MSIMGGFERFFDWCFEIKVISSKINVTLKLLKIEIVHFLGSGAFLLG